MTEYKIITLTDGLGNTKYRIKFKFKLFWFIPLWLRYKSYELHNESKTVYEVSSYDKALERILNLKMTELAKVRIRVTEELFDNKV